MITLSDHQALAVKTIVGRIKANEKPITYLAGFAGVGKSSILSFILDDLGYNPNDFWFAAPTGQAAKIMRQKLKIQNFPKTDATTIHSACYRAKPAPVGTLEANLIDHKEKYEHLIHEYEMENKNVDGPKLDYRKIPLIETQRKLILRLEDELSSLYREDKLNFQLNPDSPIQHCKLIVIDEASMVGMRMTDDLLSFGVPILAIGDPGQLPPIEDKPGLTAGRPDFFMTEIHRQAEGNPIIHLATLARNGEDLPYGDYGEGVEVLRRTQFDPQYDFATRPQFIVGLNKTRWRVNQMLRKEFGFIQKEGDRVGPREGEPIVIKKNNREYPELVNGTQATVLSAMPFVEGDAAFQMSFEDDEGLQYLDKRVFQGLFEEHFSRKQNGFSAHERDAFRERKRSICADWNFACTTHTSQGSSYLDVVVIDESSVFREDADKHLYTSLTRASKTLKVLR